MDTLGYLETLDAEVRDRLAPWAAGARSSN